MWIAAETFAGHSVKARVLRFSPVEIENAMPGVNVPRILPPSTCKQANRGGGLATVLSCVKGWSCQAVVRASRVAFDSPPTTS
jgi:hypothetical protein